MIHWCWAVIIGIVGVFVGWLTHTIFAAREFDKLLWKTEKEKQEIINQFNDYCGRLNDRIEQLEGERE